MIKDYFKKLIYLLGNEKRKLPLILFSFLVLSLMDLLGLGLIGPFMSLIISKEIDPRIISFFEYLKLDSDRGSILGISSILIISVFFY